MLTVKNILRLIFERLERGYDLAFSAGENPFRQLGALGWFCYWLVAVSGIYLYIFFDTGITQAYASIEWIMREHGYFGQVMRGLHRYASDALVIVVVLHLLREFSHDRLRGPRWFAWFTGVLLLWFIYACGLSGYWLVWDQLAQYIAIATTEWLDTLPLFGEPIALNFISSKALSGRFFTLMAFIHIAVPLIMLFVMWIHIQRYAQPRINPPRRLAAGTLLSLVALSLIVPAVSQAPADLDRLPVLSAFDWFYLAVYPLLDVVPGGWLWIALILGSGLLALLPWMPPLRELRAARVDLGNCNGCTRCADDCPFEAIRMEPRSDGRPFETEAVVVPARCVSCGICAGACPTATPYRRATALTPGIELPDQPLAMLREQLLDVAGQLSGTRAVVVFACAPSAGSWQPASADTAVLTLPCVGMLPPSFVDFVLSRELAAGVMIAGCAAGDCYHRLGDEWTRQRMARTRDPYLRARVPDERLQLSWRAAGDERGREADLRSLQERLPGAPPVLSNSRAREVQRA